MFLRFATITAVSALAMAANAQVTITLWDFNGPSATSVPGGPTSPAPSVGTGTASLIGGATGSFASGLVDGGSSDPVTTVPPNYAWNTTSYPAQGTASGTAGVQFFTSTVGFTDIRVWWDNRNSATAARHVRFDYTADGGSTWVQSVVFETPTATAWHFWGVDLSGISAVENNPNFGFRLVTVFAPGTSAYQATGATSTYGTSGTIRYDMVQVRGVPEPGTMIALGAGALGLLARRRRRQA
jgi:hypothetical protein